MSGNDGFDLWVTEENVKKFPLHVHECAEVLYYLSGSGFLRTDSGDVAFSPGKILIVPPGLRHGSVSDGTFKNVSIDFELPFVTGSEVIEVADTAEGCVSELIRIIYYYYFIDKEICRDLIKPLKAMLSKQISDSGEHLSWVEKVYLEIRESYSDCDFDVAGAVAKTHYSDDYFRLKFKSVYGITPVRFLNKLRTDRAYTLLTSASAMNISEIARVCGFSDPLYFSRMYKKFRGCSPESERRKMKERG